MRFHWLLIMLARVSVRDKGSCGISESFPARMPTTGGTEQIMNTLADATEPPQCSHHRMALCSPKEAPAYVEDGPLD